MRSERASAFALACVVLFFAPLFTALADTGGLKTFVAVDLVGEAFVRSKVVSPREVEVRGVEVYFFAPVDPLFDASVGIAAHPENGVSLFELHEATLSSSKVIPHTQMRIGKGFLNIGKLNRIHQHDWPFIDTPEVQRSFFDDEGVNDLLLEVTVNTPTFVPFEATVGIAKGWVYGHAHNAGKRPQVPTHYSRMQTFFDLPRGGGLQVAGNYLGRTASDSVKTQLLGLDLTAKWREGRTVPLLLQSEVWVRRVKAPQVDRETALGMYVFPQMNLIEMLDFGIRFDQFSVLTTKDALGKSIDNSTYRIVPTLTHKPSEFSTFRIAYAWDLKRRGDATPNFTNSSLLAQMTYVIGAHPSHEF
jgi:hypothetical protein